MRQEPSAATFFNGFADTFDTIYDEKRNAFMRWVDCTFRSDMFIRYTLTFDALDNIRGQSIVDIGCGSGPYITEALKRGASLVTGIDPAPNMLTLGRLRVRNSGFADERCILVEDKFPGAPVTPHDHAIVMGVMDYVEDAASFLTALKPVVRRSAVISFPSKHWFRTPFRRVRYRLRRCPVYFYTESDIERLCKAAGFRSVEVRKIPGAGMDYHVCVKP
ncbi:putative Methylase involved in ubiquinone/menaquinone biosynthesis [Nitrospira japonica]|uniref:Putative Methylase involved in ubiquinone/menaquinone biosynthesis n=1 Tax=Nitrospira japonica TaxID=1325564 RepID=A0A1W1IAD9_9BACT|nr:methyltransferase domain-containing protein [Nitrospira japonica]SLM49960.1 putative Methylase involved in ubiquinone/menaquinone biosynthesis [Nitrospira japonica]